MHRYACLMAAFLSLSPQLCWAWSESIHGVITLAAVDELSEEKRAEFLRLVETHPQFEEMIAPKTDKGPADREDRIIARAGYWADMVAGTEHDRPKWHFYPSLFSLDETKVPEDVQPQLEHLPPEGATLQTQELNLVQAVLLCRSVLEDKSRPDAERAVALCWLSTLVGDLYQPLRLGSLYAPPTFPAPEGDRHGQLLLVGDGTLFELLESARGEARWGSSVRRVKEELVKKGRLDLSGRHRGFFTRLDDSRRLELLLRIHQDKVRGEFEEEIAAAVGRGQAAPLRVEVDELDKKMLLFDVEFCIQEAAGHLVEDLEELL